MKNLCVEIENDSLGTIPLCMLHHKIRIDLEVQLTYLTEGQDYPSFPSTRDQEWLQEG